MSLIKINRQSIVWWTGTLLILSSVYGALVLSDYILARYTEQLSQVETDAIHRVRERIGAQDKKLIKDARAQGYSPYLFPRLFETPPFSNLVDKYGIAPLASKPYTKSYFCNEGYGLITYTTDRFGFRNQDNVWDEKSIDYLIIGDSFAHGACVNEKDTIAGNLFTKTAKVVNLGMVANGPIHYAALAKTFLKVVRPKYAIVIFYSNDNLDESNSPYRIYFAKNKIDYFENTPPDKRPKEISSKLRDLYNEAFPLAMDELNKADVAFFDRGSLAKRALKYLSLPNIRLTIRGVLGRLHKSDSLPYSTKLAIDVTMAECAELGCTPIFTYIPNSEYWDPNPVYGAQSYTAKISDYLSSFPGKPALVDATEKLSPLGQKAYADIGPHLSPLGYKLVADLIREKSTR